MTISLLAQEIKDSPTLVMNEKARRLREAGEPVIHLGSGEPQSKVPLDAILGCASKLNTAVVRYTPTQGIPSLLDAVIKYTRANYGYEITRKNVMISHGAKQAIYNLLMSILDPKDEVVILAPYWVSYPEIVRMLNGVPVPVQPPKESFLPKIEDIAARLSSKTKAIMVNSPNNPSGVVYPEGLIAELVELCEKRDIYLIMDDIYHKLTSSGVKAVSPYKYQKVSPDDSKLVTLNGVSKAYAMTGFRIGWSIANPELTTAITKVSAQNSTCPSVILQAAAAGALNGVQSSVESLRLHLDNNRKVMLQELASITGVKTIPPDGTFYCLPDFSCYNKNSAELAAFILEKAMVVVVPGGEFGAEGHLRLSYCGTINEIKWGVERIKWALDPDSPKEIYIGDRLKQRDWL